MVASLALVGVASLAFEVFSSLISPLVTLNPTDQRPSSLSQKSWPSVSLYAMLSPTVNSLSAVSSVRRTSEQSRMCRKTLNLTNPDESIG